jgi:hypothetical protein
VLVSFDISPAGHVAHLAVIWAENPDLRAHTMQLLEGARFQVPSDWATTGARQHWRAGFVYCLPPSGQSDEFAMSTRTIYIRSSCIPGLKVNNPSAPDATGPCATGN